MDMEQQVDYWLKSAAHDLEAAESLFQNQKYDWCLFIGHLVIEKVLKAFYVKNNNEVPPKIHNLLRLAENTKLKFTEAQTLFLADLNDFHIETRYPDIKLSFYKTATREFTDANFTKIKELYSWLLSLMK